jgi:integrase
MTYTDPATGLRDFRELGRLAVEDVPAAIVEAYRQIDPSAVKADGTNIRTVGDLLRAWLYEQEQRGPDGSVREEHRIAERTLLMYTGGVKRLIAVVDAMALKKLTSTYLFELRDQLAMTFAPRTVRADLKVLRQATAWGASHGVEVPVLDFRSVMKRGRRDKERVNRDRTPTHEEVAALYADLKRTGMRLGLFIAWKSGARVGEVGALRWCDVYTNADGAWVSFPQGKTGPRVFPITDEDFREIQAARPAHAADTDPMFTRSFANSSAALVVACEARGIEPFTFHGLRRLMTDTCQRRGVDVGTYAAMVGHTPEEALRAYRRPTVEDLRAALLKIRSHGISITAWLARHGVLEEDAVAVLDAWRKARDAEAEAVAQAETSRASHLRLVT